MMTPTPQDFYHLQKQSTQMQQMMMLQPANTSQSLNQPPQSNFEIVKLFLRLPTTTLTRLRLSPSSPRLPPRPTSRPSTSYPSYRNTPPPPPLSCCPVSSSTQDSFSILSSSPATVIPTAFPSAGIWRTQWVMCHLSCTTGTSTSPHGATTST